MKMLFAAAVLVLASNAYAQPSGDVKPMHAGENVGPICREGAITKVPAHDENDRHYYYTARCENGRWVRID